MEIETKAVKGTGKVVGSGMVTIPRRLAEQHNAIPSDERIEKAKRQFELLGLPGGTLLISALLMLEDEQHVMGYFGFTYDLYGLASAPLAEGETDSDRGMKVMSLTHPQWGTRTGTSTAIGDLVALSESLKPSSLSAEKVALFDQLLNEGATFLALGSSDGES